jgi:hypothetical protein
MAWGQIRADIDQHLATIQTLLDAEAQDSSAENRVALLRGLDTLNKINAWLDDEDNQKDMEAMAEQEFTHWAEAYMSILHQMVDRYVQDPWPHELAYIKDRYNYFNSVLVDHGVLPVVTPFES